MLVFCKTVLYEYNLTAEINFNSTSIYFLFKKVNYAAMNIQSIFFLYGTV